MQARDIDIMAVGFGHRGSGKGVLPEVQPMPRHKSGTVHFGQSGNSEIRLRIQTCRNNKSAVVSGADANVLVVITDFVQSGPERIRIRLRVGSRNRKQDEKQG